MKNRGFFEGFISGVIIIILVICVLNLICENATEYVNQDKGQATEVDDREGYHSRDWGEDESKCLQQLAMYIASDKDIEAKIMIINIAINRVWANGYPDTIEEVVSDLTGGQYIYEVPDEECIDAEHHVQIDGWDNSDGATKFKIEDGKVVPE